MVIQIRARPQHHLNFVKDCAGRWIAFLVVVLLAGGSMILDASAETENTPKITSSFEFSENSAAGQVGNRTIVEIYPSEGTMWFVGPDVSQSPPLKGEYFLRACKETGDKIRFQLYIKQESRHRWFFFNRAVDSNGNKFQVKQVGVGWDSGWKTEHVLIKLSRAYLNSLAAKLDFSLKVTGKQGEVVLNVPGFYVKGFIRKVDFWSKAE